MELSEKWPCLLCGSTELCEPECASNFKKKPVSPKDKYKKDDSTKPIYGKAYFKMDNRRSK